MTTKLYLHAASHALTGTFPTGEQSAATPGWSATGAATLRKMDTTIGTAQTSLSGTSLANTSLQLPFMGFFVSPPLNGNQSVTAVFRLNVALTQSNTQMNLGQYLTTCLYVWRPSTGAVVGKLLDGPADSIPLNGVAPPSAASSEKVDWGSYSTPGTMIMALDGDVLICEVWPALLQGTAAAYTANFYFDGTTENATLNATVSNHAAFLDFDDNLVFKSTAAHLAAALSSVCSRTAALTTGIHPKANAAAQVTATSALTTAIRPKANPAGHVTATSVLTTAIHPKANGSCSTTVSAAFTTAIRPKANGSSAATLSAAITTAIRPKANGSSAATLSAAITTAIRPKANGSSSTTASAAITTAIHPKAAASSSTTVSAAFTTVINPKAAAAGQVSVGAALITAIPLQASASGVSAATARLTTHDNMVATASVQVAATARLSTQIGLLAALAGQANATASLGTQILLKVDASSQSLATARLAAALAGLRAVLLDQTGAAAVLTTRIALKSNPYSHGAVTARLTTTGSLPPAEFTASAAVLTSVAVVGAVPVLPLVASTKTSAGFSVTVDTA